MREVIRRHGIWILSRSVQANQTMNGVKHKMNRHMPGLDGLRAVAVVAVLLFHAFPHALPGGFIGVDIFFVLSGYIITKTYFDRLRTGQVSLTQFYIKRVRRLAPVYILVLILTTVAAYLLINPLHLKNFSESLAAQPFYLQNIVFWQQGDYFDSPLTKPLLHTWSLAVEEQFYLLYGLLIIFVRRKRSFSIKLLILLLALLAMGSFAANYIISQISPKTSFFWLPTRIWELAIGVALGLIHKEVPRAAAPYLKWVGLLAIFSGIGLYSEDPALQGIQAAIACAGTAAVIAAVAARRSPDNILDQPAIAYIGKTSYSLYLWHWPIISIATICLDQELNTMQAIGALSLTCFCSTLSYHYVELPFRSNFHLTSNIRLLGAVAASGVLTVGAAILLNATNGAVYRYPHELAVLYTAEQQRSPYRCPVLQRLAHPSSEMCQRNKVKSDKNILIIGDSHADQLDELIAQLGERHHVGVFLATRNCNLHEFGKDSYCSNEVFAKILDESKRRNIRNIIGISFFKKNFGDERQLREALSHVVLNDKDIKRVFIMQVVPNNFYFNPKDWINALEKRSEKPKPYTIRNYLEDNNYLIRALKNVQEMDRRIRVLDPTPYLCAATGCSFASDGVPNYFDSHHLSPTGARLLTPMFAGAISAIAADGSGIGKADAPSDALHVSSARRPDTRN
jgi:peptidoglycan/LPS O-acetylase OafA/YrhL